MAKILDPFFLQTEGMCPFPLRSLLRVWISLISWFYLLNRVPLQILLPKHPHSFFFFFLKKTMYLFIWLHRVLVATCGIFRYNARTLYLQQMGSRVCGLQHLRHRDSSCGMGALECTGSVIAPHELSCSEACGILFSWQGIETECPALQGGFLTTGSSEMSQHALSLSCCF